MRALQSGRRPGDRRMRVTLPGKEAILLLVLLPAGLLYGGLLTGCSWPNPTQDAAPAASASPRGPASPQTSAFACVPTMPNGSTPPGESPSRQYHGNGRIWTSLWPGGVIVFKPGGPGETRPDGSLAMKQPFWRGPGVRGRLAISGHSVDEPALRMTGEVPSGYGMTGFQASTLVFPRPGCWSVTARVDGASLTFTTEVERRQ